MKHRAPAAASLLLTLAVGMQLVLPASASAAAGNVEGKVIHRGAPVAGAHVSFYAGAASGFTGAPDFQAGPTADDGLFRVSLPPGSYYLITRKPDRGPGRRPEAGDLYSYYGGNPVTVGEGAVLSVGINAAEIVPTGDKRLAGGTGVKGWVFAEGKPVERARVTLYQDAEGIFRGMGYASVLTAAGGAFVFNLEPGTYYVVARKRAGGEGFGPLAAGDLFAWAQDNPVEVVEGFWTAISMNMVAKQAKVMEGAQATASGTGPAGETAARGAVRDREGKPVAGIYILAYRDPMMTAKPDYISRPTGADGSWELRFQAGGEYFLAARNTLGGPAQRGDWLGRWQGGNSPVLLKTGARLEGLDITVEKVE